MAVNEDGKFTKKTPEAVKRLEEAYSWDCTVDEAVLWANISKQTLYNWFKEDPKLKERLDELKNTPVLRARQTVNEKLSENYQNAMDYLKRKKRLEFGDNIKVDGEMTITGVIQIPKRVEEKNNEGTSEQSNSLATTEETGGSID